ncbi:MAG: hypothetical protein M3N32_03700 [Actinomycetota bacterium]|nr:hypothetical protein [Actinomycetota bacterium]
MTPAKRQDTPVSQGPKRAPAPKVPDVPSAPPRRRRPVPDELMTAPVPPAAAKDGTQLLGPEGEPISQEAAAGDAGGDSAPPTQTRQVDPEDRGTMQSPRRPGGLYPLPVWPD